MKETVFSCVETTEGLTLYLLTTYKTDGDTSLICEFRLTITDGAQVWKSIVTEDDLNTMRTKVKMDMESYVQKTQEALTGAKNSDAVFHYKFKTKKDNSAEFAWQKFIPDQDIAFQLGSTSLKPSNSPSGDMCLIFKHCIDGQTQLRERIKTTETDNERLSQDRMNALKRLDKCVTAKEELEKDLYSKFVEILNNKKEKIRDLKRQVESGGSYKKEDRNDVSDPDEQEPSTSNGTRSSQQKRKTTQKDSDEETTDDEKQVSSPRKKGRYKTSSPNKSTDDSLILDDGDDSPAHSPVARRTHQRGGNRRQTPAKPVLPKVSSKEKGSTTRTPSMRKSGSSSSNRSSENLDADALLEGL